MEKRSNKLLIRNLEAKNIVFKNKNKFNKYSYYQVINAYKPLFVTNIETIDDIYFNINKEIKLEYYKNVFGISSDSDLFREVCKKIFKKYGLKYSNTLKNEVLKNEINKIKYIHHIYASNTKYEDFLRMYKFEHELRLLLLKYTLIIEESIKNVFIKFLNNTPDVKDNFLSDINNYNTSKGNNEALDTLKLILEKQKSKHSKPIVRKRKQDINIPYWILINELSMNETYNVIKNLKPEISMLIFQDCVNTFTNLKLNIEDKTKTKNQIQKEKGLILSFRNLLRYVGLFRNMLAHNQPIFCYNHKNYSLKDYPNMSYEVPWIDLKKQSVKSEIEQQHKINSVTMYDLVLFFGNDNYNTKNANRNINLSFIIYVIYKIISTIDKNTCFYNELIFLFQKYNIILSLNEKEFLGVEYIEIIKKEMEILDKLEINYNSLVNKIENKMAYKQELRSFISNYNNQKKKLIHNLDKIHFIEIKSKYGPFLNNKIYTKYTGIDKSFLNDLK